MFLVGELTGSWAGDLINERRCEETAFREYAIRKSYLRKSEKAEF